ncbi:MAG: PilT/PilU family type 4a pilus ATPase, partial [Deltaproteobacteria bacterium]|nr:PilT/PilU family type 4a pilus ATPase [Deltaproteobacteria bacterium]
MANSKYLDEKKIDVENLLRFAISHSISDIHFKSGRPPVFRKGGTLFRDVNAPTISEEDILAAFSTVMQEYHKIIFKERNEIDLGYGIGGVGRLRINIFKQRGTVSACVRVIPALIPTLEELNLPKVLDKFSDEKRGMVLVTGAAGQGKSTTLACIVDNINKKHSSHIITIEDPIEYIIEDRKSIVNQREVGIDTMSFQAGLRSALRQDPDVIVIGEMRDRETIEIAMHAAETGHLVFSTLHTIDAKETLNRILSVFRGEEKEAAKIQLSSILKGVVSLRLLPKSDGKGRVPACEVLVNTPRVADLLRKGDKIDEITTAIAQGMTVYGMQTFDQSLMNLF